MRLSIVIPHINEWRQLHDTLIDIRHTAGNDVEIIVVDDATETPPPGEVNLGLANHVVYNRFRCGAGPSRHIGAEKASGDYILITDSHMRFPMGWFARVGGCFHGVPANSVICGVCRQLTETHTDVNHPVGAYYGATFNFYGPDRFKPGSTQIFEGSWLDNKPMLEAYEIPCAMGACYLVNREFYLRMSPHRYLKLWGKEEEALSLKTWLCGGKVILNKAFQVGHLFRWNQNKLPFSLPTHCLIFNKLFLMHTILPEEYCRALFNKMPRDANFHLAYQHLRDNWHLVETERAYNRRIFTRDFPSLLTYWGLTCPGGSPNIGHGQS